MQSNVSTGDGSAAPTSDHADSPPDEDEPDDSASTLSRDVVFDVLSSTRRRYVLHHLRRAGGATTLKELSTTVASWEYDRPPEEVSSKQRTRVYTALRQSHLPKMDREGVVDFDPDSGDVTITSEARDLEVYLDIVPHDEIPWSTYYLGVGLIGTVVALATWLDVVPLAAVPDGLAALSVAVLVTVSAAVHVRYHRNNRRGSDEPPPI